MNGPSPSSSSIETFSMPSQSRVLTVVVSQSRFSVSTAPTRSGQPGQQHMSTNWFDMVYPRYSPSILSDDYTIPSQMSVEVPAGTSNSNNNSNVRWSFLFPSAPLVVGHQAPGRVFCLGRARRRRVCQVRVRCRAPRDRPSATQPVRFLRIRFIYMSLTLAQNRVYRRNL